MKIDVYQVVTDQIIAALESGVAPWKKPWKTAASSPQNWDGRPYRSINAFLLGYLMQSNEEWEVPCFVTFNKAKSLGGRVKKGEKSTLVTFWKKFLPKDQVGLPKDMQQARFMLRYFRVFNVAQCEGLPALPKRFTPDESAVAPEPVAEAVRIVEDMPQPQARSRPSNRPYPNKLKICQTKPILLF